LTPYVPGEQPGQQGLYVKLNTNENPYPPSPAVEDALRRYRWEDLRLYPDPCSLALRTTIAGRFELPVEQIFVGNGSDEVLSFAWYGFFDPENGPVLFPEHTYSFYPVYCDYYGQPYERIPLASDFSVDISLYLERMKEEYAGIVIPNPNAPTGIAISLQEIETLLQATEGKRLVIIDEAYVDFGTETSVGLIERYPNLLVVHTCSKSRCLAGLRVGYAIGSKEVIQTITAVKDSFNSYPLDRLSQKIADIAIQDDVYYDKIRDMIMATRRWFAEAIRKEGWEVLPSQANFIFARYPGASGDAVYHELKSKGVLVRHFEHPGIEDFLRITIGTDREMERLLLLIKDLTCTAGVNKG
jgi:histidinol-phosphate aminotransferase